MTSEDADSSAKPSSSKPFEFRSNKAHVPAEAAGFSAPSSDPERTPLEEPPVDRGVQTSDPLGDDALPAGEQQRTAALAGVGLGYWLLMAVAVVSVVMAVLSWRDANGDPDRERAAARDLAVIEGTKAVETMNSMDHRNVEAGVKAWQDVSTGVLHDQLLVIDDDQKKLLSEQGKIATGRVVQAALTDLSDRTATMIVAVEVTVRDGDTDTDPAVKRNRYEAKLALVKDSWKIEDLQQVAVNVG